MAGTISRFSPEAVQATIANFKSRSSEFQGVINAIKGAMFDLEGTWTGAAEQAYEAQTRALLKNLETIMQSIDGAVGKLNLAIQKYEEVEQTQKGAIEGHDTNAGSYVE